MLTRKQFAQRHICISNPVSCGVVEYEKKYFHTRQQPHDTEDSQNTGSPPLLSDLYCVYVCWREHEGRVVLSCGNAQTPQINTLLLLVFGVNSLNTISFFFIDSEFGSLCNQINGSSFTASSHSLWMNDERHPVHCSWMFDEQWPHCLGLWLESEQPQCPPGYSRESSRTTSDW